MYFSYNQPVPQKDLTNYMFINFTRMTHAKLYKKVITWCSHRQLSIPH